MPLMRPIKAVAPKDFDVLSKKHICTENNQLNDSDNK